MINNSLSLNSVKKIRRLITSDFARKVNAGNQDGNVRWNNASAYDLLNTQTNIYTQGFDSTYTRRGFATLINVTIPKNAVINSASLDVDVTFNIVGGSNFFIYARKEANPSIVSDGGNDVWNCPLTTNFVSQNLEGYNAKTTQDISTIIQEIINQENWQSGNNIQFVFVPDGDINSCQLSFATYEAEQTESRAALELNINYSYYS